KDCFQDFLPRLEIIRQTAKENILLAQSKYTAQYNKYNKVKVQYIQEGTKVLLKTMQMPAGPYRKLTGRFQKVVHIVTKRLQPTTSNTYIIQNMRTHKKYPSPVNRDKLKVFKERRQDFYNAGKMHAPDIVDEPDTDSDSDDDVP